MIRALFTLWQAATPATGEAAPLPSFSTVPHCRQDLGDDDVVVCGHVDQSRYRLPPLPPRYRADDTGLPKAETPLGGGTLGVTTQGGSVGGIATNRVMLGWKPKF